MNKKTIHYHNKRSRSLFYLIFFAVLYLCSSCKTNSFFICKRNIRFKDSSDYQISRSICTKFYNPFLSSVDSILGIDKNIDSPIPVFVELVVNGKSQKGTLSYYIYSSSVPIFRCDIKKQKISGQCISRDIYNAQRIAEVGSFKKNKLDGEYKLYHADSILIYTQMYKKGRLVRQIDNKLNAN